MFRDQPIHELRRPPALFRELFCVILYARSRRGEPENSHVMFAKFANKQWADYDKPKPPKTEKPTLMAEQVRSVVAAMSLKYRPLAALIVLTSLRIGEALGLQWQDIDTTAGKLYIRRSIWRGKVQPPKPQSAKRTKHLTPQLAAALQAQRINAVYTAPDDFIFASSRGTPLNPDDGREALYEAMDAVGIKRSVARAYGYHLLRHTAGSVFQEVNDDLKQTSAYMGHSNISITADTYLHLREDSQREAAIKQADALFPSTMFSTVFSKAPRTVN
jgi:integrase